MVYRLPNYDERTAVVGSTGSGKTQLASWMLSTRDFHIRPWFIIAFKDDELLNAIVDNGGHEISLGDKLPRKQGIYLLRAVAEMNDDDVKAKLREIWENGESGLFCDECSGFGIRNYWVNAIQSQGRSLGIETIMATQRPAFVPNSIFTEANHFYVMRLQKKEDRQKISGYLDDLGIRSIPAFHSQWYYANKQENAILKPVPSADEIISTFQRRLTPNLRKVYAL